MNFPFTQFLMSVADLTQLPADEGREIAFVGRSNAGKSSALNAITGHKNLARTSKTPGRTQLINFFTVDNPHSTASVETTAAFNRHRLVDLPGYGYANVASTVKERWQKNILHYLTMRRSLCGLILIMDSRHPYKETDQLMLTWAADQPLPVHILLTKADKLSRQDANKTLQNMQSTISIFQNTTLQLFSSVQHTGVELARQKILTWLALI